MLPKDFVFSASSLQDYLDCPRRFQLRYVQRQLWPGAPAEPLSDYERHLQRGTEFHRLVQRHQLGIDAAVLEAGIADVELRAWWAAYRQFDVLHGMAGRRYAEYTLSCELVHDSFDPVRLSATFDLLVVQAEGRVVIFDWKTALRNPGRAWFERQLQTLVYPVVVWSAVQRLLGKDVGGVSMVYWLVALGETVSFDFLADSVERLRERLVEVVREVRAAGDGVWRLTEEEVRCRYCEYRSLCGRGSMGGELGGINTFDNIAGWDLDLGLGEVVEVGW